MQPSVQLTYEALRIYADEVAQIPIDRKEQDDDDEYYNGIDTRTTTFYYFLTARTSLRRMIQSFLTPATHCNELTELVRHYKRLIADINFTLFTHYDDILLDREVRAVQNAHRNHEY